LDQIETVAKVAEVKPTIIVEGEMPIVRVISAVKSGCGACG